MTPTQIIYTKSAKETIKLGQSIARQLSGGEVIALVGNLGSGKTILTKGIAKGLGIKKIVNSPTFVLMKIYPIKCPLGNFCKQKLFNRVYPVKSREAGISPKAKLFNRVNPVKSREAGISPKAKLSNRVNPVKRGKINYLCHIDAYRLDNGQQLLEIGVQDWLGQPKAITVIEWADRVANILPKNTILIKIKTEKKPSFAPSSAKATEGRECYGRVTPSSAPSSAKATEGREGYGRVTPADTRIMEGEWENRRIIKIFKNGKILSTK